MKVAKNYNKKLRIAALSMAVMMFITFPTASFAAKTKNVTPKVTPETLEYTEPDGLGAAAKAGVYWLERADAANYRFVNAADGYSICIPKSMQVTDMSNSAVVSVLEDEHRRLEIFVSQEESVVGYLNYGYGFANDTDSHTVVYDADTQINGLRAHIKQWQRDSLACIENDHCYYASVDIIEGNTIYNLFFSADVPFWQCGGYLPIAQTFQKAGTAKNNGLSIIGHSVEKPYWNDETKALYAKLTNPEAKLEWGIYCPEGIQDLDSIEANVEYQFKYTLVYSSIKPVYDPALSINLVKSAWLDGGRVTELTLQTPLNITGRNMIYDVLDHRHDDFLHAYAKAIADFKHPVLFRPFNEMNGDWCNYSSYNTARDTNIYRELYKYIYKIFDEEGANANTLWVWNPNGKSYPKYAWNDMTCYYPGDRYVDIVGITGYNTGTYYESEKWHSFETVYDAFYDRTASLYSQPIIITEFSCSEYGGDKPAWVYDMFQKIHKYDRIRVAIWWSGYDKDAEGNIAREYRIDHPYSTMDVFRRFLNQ